MKSSDHPLRQLPGRFSSGLRWAIAALALGLAGCANLGTGVDGQACVGQLPAAVVGLSPTANSDLLAKAQLPVRQGGVCVAAVYAVAVPVAVFRVYDGSRPSSAYGAWWSLTRPSGSRDQYRAQNAICPEWSALDRLIACQLKPGTAVVLGTTQSAVCKDQSEYPQTASIQVFVANDTRHDIVLVDQCQELGDWP